MLSLTDASFKLQKSFTKRKLVSKTWAAQDRMLVQDVWSPEINQTFWSTWENARFLYKASHYAEIAFWKNSECFSASRLKNGGDTNVKKGSLLTPIPSLTSSNLKGKCHPLPSRVEDDRTRTDVLFPPAQALINNLQVLIFDPFMAGSFESESPIPERSILSPFHSLMYLLLENQQN